MISHDLQKYSLKDYCRPLHMWVYIYMLCAVLSAINGKGTLDYAMPVMPSTETDS